MRDHTFGDLRIVDYGVNRLGSKQFALAHKDGRA